MTTVLTWLSYYRGYIVFLFGVGLWFAAYYLYFGNIVRNYFAKQRPHSWSIDMERKQVSPKLLWKPEKPPALPKAAGNNKPKPGAPGAKTIIGRLASEQKKTD